MSGWNILNSISQVANDKWNTLEQSIDEAVGNTPIKDGVESIQIKKQDTPRPPPSTATLAPSPTAATTTTTTNKNEGWTAWSPSVSQTASPLTTIPFDESTKTQHKQPSSTTATTATATATATNKNKLSALTLKLKKRESELRTAIRKLRESRSTQKEGMEQIQTLEAKIETQSNELKQKVAHEKEQQQKLQAELTAATEAEQKANQELQLQREQHQQQLHLLQQQKEERDRAQEKETTDQTSSDSPENDTTATEAIVAATAAADAAATAATTAAANTIAAQKHQCDQLQLQLTTVEKNLQQSKATNEQLQHTITSSATENKEYKLKLSRRAQQLETIHLQFADQHETEKEQIAQIETYQKENEELTAQIQSLEDHRLHYEQETDVKMKEFQMQIKHSSLHNMEEENKWVKLKEQTEKNNSILENKLKQQLEKNNAIMEEGVKWSKEVRRYLLFGAPFVCCCWVVGLLGCWVVGLLGCCCHLARLKPNPPTTCFVLF